MIQAQISAIVWIWNVLCWSEKCTEVNVIFDLECCTHCRLRLATEDEIKYGTDLLCLHVLSQELGTMKVSHMCFLNLQVSIYIYIDIDQMQTQNHYERIYLRTKTRRNIKQNKRRHINTSEWAGDRGSGVGGNSRTCKWRVSCCWIALFGLPSKGCFPNCCALFFDIDTITKKNLPFYSKLYFWANTIPFSLILRNTKKCCLQAD